MNAALVFPKPRDMSLTGQTLVLAKKGEIVGVEVMPDDSMLALRAVEELRGILRAGGCRLGDSGEGRPRVVLEIAESSDEAEDYEIEVTDSMVYVASSSARGALCAVRTLAQMATVEDGRLCLPCGTVRDWPALRYRGIFQEATHSSSFMALDDWKALVDTHAGLKMNMIMVGLYSCWRRADHTKEYLLVPFKKHPKLVTPQEIDYFSGVRGERVRRTALPLMAEQDFFGEVIGYAAERGVAIVPYFSALGHNTLVPRIYPDVSMKDENGEPIGYGFCTGNPKTYDLLFALFDEIIDRYAEPHGLDMFGIGMDEVRATCLCERCKRAPNKGVDTFIVRHVLRLAEHLKKRGMRRVIMWHDMLERGGLLNREFASKLKRKKLDDTLAIAWWGYSDQRAQQELNVRKMYQFATFRPELGLVNWAVPSAGWNYPMPLALSRESNVRSIMTHAQIADRDGAEAMSSYSSHDPIFAEGYCALAEYSWNPGATNDLRQFRERYYRLLFAEEWDAGRALMERMEEAFASWSSLFSTMFSRSHQKLSPGPAIVGVPVDQCNRDAFLHSIATLEDCGKGLRQMARTHKARADVVRMYATDCDYTAAVLDVSLGTLEIIRDYRRARLAPESGALSDRMEASCEAYEKRIERLTKAMAAIERTRADSNVPYILNRITGLRDFAFEFLETSRELLVQLRKGYDGVLPLYSDSFLAFYGDNLGVKPF